MAKHRPNKKRTRAKRETLEVSDNSPSKSESLQERGEEIKRQADETLEMVEKAIEDYIRLVGENFAVTYIQRGGE